MRAEWAPPREKEGFFAVRAAENVAADETALDGVLQWALRLAGLEGS